MCRYIIYSIVILFQLNYCYSQDSLFVLHPAIGDSIDKNEKLQYLLFPEVSNSDFIAGFLKYSNGCYFLNSTLLNDSLIITKIDTAEIRKYRMNVEKLFQFYSNQKEDTVKVIKLTLELNKTTDPIEVMDDEMKAEIATQGNINASLRAWSELRGLTGEKKERFMRGYIPTKDKKPNKRKKQID